MNGRPMGRDDRRRPQGGLRINHRIRVPEVRVIMDDGGEQLGVLPTHEAVRLAEEKGLDLVEISPRAFPPVCRIMDYGKYKYEQSKQKQKARKHASTVEIKEIKFRPKTEGHDMDFKVKHVRRFLEAGNKVRLAVVFRGREITHPQTGKNVLDRVVDATADLSTVEVMPNMEGRRMIMIIAPKPNVVRRAAEIRKQTIAAIQAKKDAAKAAGHAPPPEPEEEDEDDELDAINADVDDSDEDDDGGTDGGGTSGGTDGGGTDGGTSGGTDSGGTDGGTSGGTDGGGTSGGPGGTDDGTPETPAK